MKFQVIRSKINAKLVVLETTPQACGVKLVMLVSFSNVIKQILV